MILHSLTLRRGTVPDLSDLTTSSLVEPPRWEGEDLHLIFDVEPAAETQVKIRRRLITEDPKREADIEDVLRLRAMIWAQIQAGALLSEVPEIPQLLFKLMEMVVPELDDPSSAALPTPIPPDLEV